MKFAHIADCHLGSWRHSELQELNMQAFEKAIGICISEKTDFILIAGDLFDTSLPNIDVLKRAAAKLKELSDLKISVYLIPGSHDFSPSGKTMLDVLEKAGLCINLANLIKEDDEKISLGLLKQDGLVLSGFLGRKGAIENQLFKKIDKKELEKELEKLDGLKIFLVHAAISELLPQGMQFDSVSIEDIPKGFDYYAAGHIHKSARINNSGKIYTYAGPLFPNNFSELVELKHGSFCIVNYDANSHDMKIKDVPLKLLDILSIEINASNKNGKQVESEILEALEKSDLKDKIFALRIYGELNGKISEINLKELEKLAREKGCFAFLKNTYGLSIQELNLEKNIEFKTPEEIENSVIDEYIKGLKKDKDALEKKQLLELLLAALNQEKNEGETTVEFEKRLIENSFSKIYEL